MFSLNFSYIFGKQIIDKTQEKGKEPARLRKSIQMRYAR